MTQKYIVIDLETTGNSPKKGDRIIQFAGVVIENDEIVEEYSTYIHPGQEISVFIEELTGISDETVKDAPIFEEVAERIAGLLEGACFVAHNVLFDLSFLQEELIRCGYEPFYGSTLDTVELAKIMKPTAEGYKLQQLTKASALPHHRPHQADSDAYATALLLLELKKKMFNLPVMTLKQLYRLSFSLQSEISELLSECIAKKLSKAEQHQENLVTYRGIAFKKTEPKNEELRFQNEYPNDDSEKIRMMQKAFPKFEARSGQLQMMDLVYESFTEGRHAMIEAGTGIGKSLGYLFPAAYFAKKHQTPAIISTYTLQLQDQLLNKEIPKLKEILPFPFQAVLLKGRNNYLSMAKFERALRGKEDNYETAMAKMQILIWLTETETGDRDELNLSSGGQLFWERLQSDGLTYEGLKKPWMVMDFFEKAKRTAANADLIITNHAFLMADFVNQDPLFPKHGYIVLDEAHNLAKAASKQLGRRLDYITVKTLMNRLGHSEQKLLLYRFGKLLRGAGLSSVLLEKLDSRLNDFSYEFDQLFFTLGSQLEQSGRTAAPARFSFKAGEARWKTAGLIAERLIALLAGFLNDAGAVLGQLKEANQEFGKNALFDLNDMEITLFELERLKDSMSEFFLRPKKDNIYWIDYASSSSIQGISLMEQPIAGSKEIWEAFFAPQHSIIMTSATLRVKQSFEYFKREMGIEDHSVKSACFPSPFTYSDQAKILVPSDIPDIQSVSMEEYSELAANHIIAAVQAAKGRTMILFTSYEMLKNTYSIIKESGALDEYTLFAHGVSGGSKHRMLRNFQLFDKAVLFGTTSLWEGVDIPGEDLSCLIMARLPFSPPDEPVHAAKRELLEEQGKNAFSALSLPEAILRFRQGFGRLIRTSEDRGVMVILDRRVMSARYGAEFRNSIPKVEWRQLSIAEMSNEIEQWV
ncbi:ATP-dependent DNA helicase DinG [Bacillus massiliglaciei]|uniref:ATP-dependent DNA helicase DinG n=1 Tax=Bacillus massiliglaciei TaxID=1816693 RepID=UPI000AF43895|nr:ATP-dependent DNA helicase DinG [Bacillus massiliglaciei]